MAIDGVITRMMALRETLPESEAKIARWILDNPRQALEMTVRDLSLASDSSQAAVIRLCKSLEVDGFQQLKVLLTADVVREEMGDDGKRFSEISPHTPFTQLLHNFEAAILQSIRETMRSLPEDHLQMLADWVITAPRLVVYGVGASAVVGMDCYQKLLRMGFNVAWVEDFHMAAVAVSQLGPTDVAIVISYSGETSEVLEVAQMARDRAVRIVAATRFSNRNPLEDIADLTFHVHALEPVLRVGATGSLLASLAVVDTIMLFIANKYAELMYPRLQKTRDAVLAHRRPAVIRE